MTKDLKEKQAWLNENFGEPVKRKIKPNPDEWRPMYSPKYPGYPPSPEVLPTALQLKMIMSAIGSLNLDPNKVVFYLNNRSDGKVRRKNINELLKGDAWDILETNVRKGLKGFKKLIEE